MTFRRDSDILDSYGAIAVAKIGETPPPSSSCQSRCQGWPRLQSFLKAESFSGKKWEVLMKSENSRNILNCWVHFFNNATGETEDFSYLSLLTFLWYLYSWTRKKCSLFLCPGTGPTGAVSTWDCPSWSSRSSERTGVTSLLRSGNCGPRGKPWCSIWWVLLQQDFN